MQNPVIVKKSRLNKFDAILFMAMTVVCGVYSSSTPDIITPAEIFIGFALVYLVGIKGMLPLLAGLAPPRARGTVPQYVIVSMLYFIIVPSITGLLINGNDPYAFIRDFIPLMYFFLPVFLIHEFKSAPPEWLLTLLLGLCAIGVAYSIRQFTTSGEADFTQVGKQFIWGGNLDNISQDPAVIYIMALLVVWGLSEFLYGKLLYGATAIVLAVFPWAANIASVTRSSVGLCLAVALFSVIYLYAKNKVRNKFAVIGCVALILFGVTMFGASISGFIQSTASLLIEKSRNVGWSARDSEILAILNNANTPGLVLFGTGWGGVYSDPINAGGLTRYSHNSFAFYFLKGGVLGVIFYGLYLRWFFRMLMNLWRNMPNRREFAILISLIPPLTISLLLEPMYKSLSCGLVLSIIPVMQLVRGQRDL